MNPEGERKKVLFVCAQGRLRSATAMHLMNQMYGYNTRCCGVDEDAIIQVSEGLLAWADEIYVMNAFQQEHIQTRCIDLDILQQVKNLDIPDEYEYMDSELCSLIQRRFFS